jgi:hyperosmotically inducible periplasmic protein
MRSLLRAVLVIAMIAIVGMFLFGYWTGSTWKPSSASTTAPVATTGTIDTEKARERGAEIGEKAAVAVEKVKETVSEAQLTGKIKAKMALDDMVKARAVDVSTSGTTVTLTGTVSSQAEHDRAVALARETNGVSRVVDALRISR